MTGSLTASAFNRLGQYPAAVFEKTCEATQKNVKSHVFWVLKKKRKKRKKNVQVGLLNL